MSDKEFITDERVAEALDEFNFCEEENSHENPCCTVSAEAKQTIQHVLREYQGWQPIETAPKDGTKVLLTNGSWVETARWANCDERFEGENWQWLLVDCEDGYYNVTAEPNEPTHWMPLPEPPKEIQDEG